MSIFHSTDTAVFGLRITDDSMLGSDGPQFAPGWVAVVDPTIEAGLGDYVAVRLADARTLLRVLEKEGTTRVLQALNPEFPAMALPQNAVVLGVIIQINSPALRRAA
jgi:SOS-response transcriptional repressor LexA